MVALQSLLAARFQLVTHFETKDKPVYVLVGKEPKLKESPEANGFKAWSWPGGAHVEGSGSLAQFADALSRLTDRPVVDESGLSGNYESTLEWAPQEDRAPDGAVIHGATADGADRVQAPAGRKAATQGLSGTEAPAIPTLFTALAEQFGLQLEARTRPVRVLVVDRAERVPTGN
jgi:uncharacterized protein (TIGR03435 family)